MLILFVKKSVFDPKFELIDLKRTNYKALSLEGFVPLWVNLLPQNECGQWMSCLSKVNFQKKYYNLQTQSSETFCANWPFYCLRFFYGTCKPGFYCLPFFYGTCRSGFIDISIKTFLRFRPIKVDSLVNTDNAECLSKFKLSITRPSNFCFGFSQIFFDQAETVLFLLKWLSWWWSWVIFWNVWIMKLRWAIFLSEIIIKGFHHPKPLERFHHWKPPARFHNRPTSSEALTIPNFWQVFTIANLRHVFTIAHHHQRLSLSETSQPCMKYLCHAFSCYLELLDKLQKPICRTVGPSPTTTS